MKKLVLSLAFVLMGSFAIGQELTKEQIKEQKKQRKALMSMVQDTEAKIQQNPVAAANALKTATSNELVNTDAYVWFVSTSAKKAVIDNENRKLSLSIRALLEPSEQPAQEEEEVAAE